MQVDVDVEIVRIDNSLWQIKAKTNSKNEEIKKFMIKKVTELARKAEKCNGIVQHEFVEPHTIMTKTVVYATYRFLSGIDIEAFLKECDYM